MKKKRTSTVEPVFGTLTQFLGMRKVNTRGLAQANKVMHMAAIAYNLKKYLKFTQKLTKSKVREKVKSDQIVKHFQDLLNFIIKLSNLPALISR